MFLATIKSIFHSFHPAFLDRDDGPGERGRDGGHALDDVGAAPAALRGTRRRRAPDPRQGRAEVWGGTDK